MFICCAAVLIGRNTGRARPSICFRSSIPFGLLTPKRKNAEKSTLKFQFKR